MLINKNPRPEPKNLTFSHLYWHVYSNSYEIDNNGKSTGGRPDWGPVILVPLLATVILAVTVFLLIVFRQSPSFVITVVTACIVFILIYLVLTVVQNSTATFE